MAQEMRRNPTDAERKMWWLLRTLKPLGMHFRRQAPIGNFIGDFVWYAGKLVVEIDGSQHAEAQKAYDDKRTEWLESQGFLVLRYWNNDVLKSTRSVGEAIFAVAQGRIPLTCAPVDTPTPNPSPQVGGESDRASGERVPQ